MAKAPNLVPVLLLVDKTIHVHDEPVRLLCGQVYDLEPKDADSLKKQGVADDTPANIAFHRGDMELYEKLLQASAKPAKPVKPTAPAAD